MKLKLLRLLFLCALFLTVPFLNAQDEEVIDEEVIEEEVAEEEYEKEAIDFTEFLSQIQSAKTDITLSDYQIILSHRDRSLAVTKHYVNQFKARLGSGGAKKINIYNCDFILSDNTQLIFEDWNIDRLNIVGCTFAIPVLIQNTSIEGHYPANIENCHFYEQLHIVNQNSELGSIQLRNNDFKLSVHIDMGLSGLSIHGCRFTADSLKFLAADYEKTYYQLNIGETAIEKTELLSNEFDNSGLNNIYSVDLGSANIAELKMKANRMMALNLSGADIEKALLIDSLYVSHFIGILNFDFPEKNTNVSWFNFGNEKFAIFQMERSGLVIPYQAKNDEQLADNLLFNDLLSAYNKFNSLYHDRGDIISANASYVEIKNIETRKQAYIQRVSPSFNNLINYKLNVFLRFFSDYATNPGKSLIQSLWVLLCFTLLYMFSFSRWDGMNYNYYISQYKAFARYIKTNDSIDEVYHTKQDPLVNEISELKEKYVLAGKDLPRILRLFGGSLHFIGKFRYSLAPKLIRLFNFQNKTWKKLGTGEKVWSGFLIFSISLSFLIYILFVKFFNSLIMSLNSFVVIGFGALPEETERFAMYLSIIEGIIGWWLLTIFTITLLSQVLQGA